MYKRQDQHRGIGILAQGREPCPTLARRDHNAVLAREAIAVSYTHLRAHETVLDLVCRLLLEKKNTRINQHDKYKQMPN